MLRLLISGALLATILWAVPVEQLGASLRGVAPLPFLGALALMPCMFYLAATQTKILTDRQGLTLGVGQIFRVTFATAFYGLLLPGAIVGGAIRWYKFSQQDKKPAQALAAIVFGRLMSTVVLVAVGFACWALDSRARQAPLHGLLLAVLLLGLVILYGLFFRRRQALAVASLVEGLPRVPQLVRGKIAKTLHAAADFEGLPILTIAAMTAVYTLYHVLGIVSFFLLAQALALDLSFVNVGWVRAYVFVLAALPISISGLGVREGALIFLLQDYGIVPAVAVAYSFLILARTLFTAAVGGAIELVEFFRPAEVPQRS
jgi:glycosyltransferase 2 family protein